MPARPHLRARRLAALSLALACGQAQAQWNPPAGQWGKTAATDVRVMTWNIEDGICRTNNKVEDLNDWSALARTIATLKPDILILQECGDNAGEGTGSGVDSVSQLTTVINYLFHGGTDSFKSNTPITSWVQKYAPTYDLTNVYVSTVTDNFNRNVILSRWPFQDLNGDSSATISTFVQDADLYSPGGTAGIRGMIFAEINLPDATYAGNIVVATAHFKSGGATQDYADRLTSGKNVGYYIDYFFNGGGTGIPDPHNKIFDAGATSILSPTTPVVWGGDFNEDENTNGRDGPVFWMANAPTLGGTDGTDRDRTDSTYDDARDPFNNSRATEGSAKFDYIIYQDSIAAVRRSFIFNTGTIGGANTYPPECIGYTGSPALVSSFAADHKTVVVDFILPAAVTPPGAFSLISPADSAVGQTLTPTLSWSVSTGATSYTVKVSASPSLTSPIWTTSTASTSATIPGSLLASCSEYYWGVTASNTAGSTGSTPASFFFETHRPADFDQSGFVDVDDYDAFVHAFEIGGDDADFNGSGFVDIDDFDDFVHAFEAGC